MNVLKIIIGIVLLGVLITVIQLADPPSNSPTVTYQRLPDANLKTTAEVAWGDHKPEAALLLLDYVVETDRADKADALSMREKIFSQLASDKSPVSRIKATGWMIGSPTGNSFESLAGSTIADSVLYGEIAELSRQGGLDNNPDDFITDLNNIRSMTAVFPPADGAITLAKAARLTGALNGPLTHQLRQMLAPMLADPKSSLAVDKFKDNFMPLLELSKHCRTWGEFQTIVQQADSSDQLKVLTKMVSATPATSKRLSQVLTVADHDGRAVTAACINDIMRQGPKRLDALYAAIDKGSNGLRFVLDRPGFVPVITTTKATPPSTLDSLQTSYQALRFRYGPIIPAAKYAAIAFLCSLLVLIVVPGRYLEKLIARPGSEMAAPNPIHYFLSALAVGLVLSVLSYLLSIAVQPIPDTNTAMTAANAATGEPGSAVATALGRSDNALLSGTVVMISLVIHAMVWFFVRSKIRTVEDDEEATPELRLRRLENLDIFLDLPLFTGLALTVVAFILITLNAGMSRHFAYTSTVVGILSAVSLRVQYLYPLKERLIQPK